MRAIIFELFDTLVTDESIPKYTLRDSAKALDMRYETFAHEWEKIQSDRYSGKICGTLQAYKTILKNLDVKRDEAMLVASAKMRDEYKNKCYESVDPAILTMLSDLRKSNFKIGIISNCATEEVLGLPDSKLDRYLDVIVLSCDLDMLKPDKRIYEHCLAMLGECAVDCFYVGTDITNNDLVAAQAVGMKVLKALWYIKNYKNEFASGRSFPSFYKVGDLVPYIMENYFDE
jgi:putative hydrolase of the HAD superfamily